MRDITERYLNSLNGIDDDSPLFLSPNAEREYRESINEYKKHRKENIIKKITILNGRDDMIFKYKFISSLFLFIIGLRYISLFILNNTSVY